SEWGMIVASCLFALAFAWHWVRRRRQAIAA
ncbi:IPTL-CTERM sorting domain-containing protein, partial [Candidatus Bipolaricaulota bacterium]|nr:IPTL-CTERM sorting domain-containing protein [Candidatus Bipolaricaulota bacterium]